MFEQYTEEYFMDQAREMGQALDVDTREGSVYMDAATGHCMRAAKFYNDLSTVFEMISIDTCTGDVLTEKALDRQIYRLDATPAYYNAIFEGVDVADMVGERFMVEGYFFTLSEYDDGIYLMSEIDGSSVNSLLSGQTLIPVKNIANLTSATLGSLYMAGTDTETDDSLRARYRDAVQGPAENGNLQQYKTWCENIEGVGRAIMTPLAYGDNTLKALIISSDGAVPTTNLIDEIQEIIDPGSQGLGEGMAFVGCKFYAVPAVATQISISLNAELVDGYNVDTATTDIKTFMTQYLKEIALSATDDESMVIQYVKIVSGIADLPSIRDFTDLQVNNGSVNITIETDHVGVLGEVTVNVSV